MPKPRKQEIIRCPHFAWRLGSRDGVWYADGRSNTPNAGRHSLGTKIREEALKLLPQLDESRAAQLGLIARRVDESAPSKPLLLTAGRKLFDDYTNRPRVTGGVRASTAKRYRTVFDKFLKYAASRGVTIWNAVSGKLLTDYAADLASRGYAHKTLRNELVVLKQTVKWLVEAGHLIGTQPIKLKLLKAESQRAYCWRPVEVAAIVEYCREREDLSWLGDVTVALACTGLRISELASLRWADIDLESARIRLTDETALPAVKGRKRREIKNGRSRSFPIHSDLLTMLRKRIDRDGYVFHGPRSGRLKPDTVRRILVRDVLEPLADRFPSTEGEQGFRDGRLHSFRHYFCSTCGNSAVPERMVMEWLGHQDSEMVRHYYHLHDEEARRRMATLNFLGAGSRAADVVR